MVIDTLPGIAALPRQWSPDDHLHASDGWSVRPISHRAATELIVEYHYSHSSSNTGTRIDGLFDPDDALVGATLWIPPTKAAALTVNDDWQRVLSCSRLVVVPDQPTNAASFMLGRSMRAIDRTIWPTFLTYADTNQGHTGAIYRATNWLCLGPVPAGDTWVHARTGEQRGRKRGGFTYTADQMIALGYVRQPNRPKIKFVHHV